MSHPTADSNLGSIAYAFETVWGTPPTSGYRKFPLNGETLSHEKETIESGRIRDDRGVEDLIEVGQSAAGGIEFELSYAALLPFIAAALCTEAVVSNFAGNATAALTGQTLTSAPAAYTGIPVGSNVLVAGFANAANNGIKRVVGVNGDGSVLTLAPGSITVNEGPVAVTVKGNHLRNGIARKSMTWERRLRRNDGVPFYQQFYGQTIDGLSLSFASKEIITGELTFLGRIGDALDESIDVALHATAATGTLTLSDVGDADDEIVIGGRTYVLKTAPALANEIDIGATAADTAENIADAINGDLGGTPEHADVVAVAVGATVQITAKVGGIAGNAIATTTDGTDLAWGAATLTGGVDGGDYLPSPIEKVMNASKNIGDFRFDGQTATECFKTLEMNLTNGLRGKDCMGTVGNFDVGLGDFRVEGSFSAYFRSNALYKKFLNHEAISLQWTVTDAAGNRFVFSLPYLQTSTALPPIEGRNVDVMLNVDFLATIDPVTAAVFTVDYFPAGA